MKRNLFFTAGIVGILSGSPVFAQEGAPVSAPVVVAAATTSPSLAPTCELHIWPTENYLGINLGLLSGLGPIGVVADMASHTNRVKSVKEQMADHLGPEIQIEELAKLNVADKLKLTGYTIVIEEPTPFNEEVRKDPILKAKAKALNARIKSGQRLSASTSTCYAELITTHIFYHKAMMYGSNLFTGWIYRDFGAKPLAIKTATGQVKNPLEYFPAKTPDKLEAAKAELRDAYSKDFIEYVQKKVAPVG